MKKHFFLTIAIIMVFNSASKSQFYENFSSFDLSTNNWQGMLSEYKISTSTAIPASLRPALQLDDDVANTSYLCAPYTLNMSADSLEWSFWVKLSFMATTNNHARVYIVSDELDVTGNVNGYFVGIGETDKKITLVKQTGSTLTPIITGTYADLSASTNELRVRVTRYANGTWKLYSDLSGGTSWVLEGTGNDNTYTSSLWHGIYCKYTVSSSTKVYFDEFYAGEIIVDTIKPTIANIQVASQFQLNITFSEIVDSADVHTFSNYMVDNGIGQPNDILKDATNPLLYYLSFTVPFPDNVVCTLSVSNISDLAGNTMLNAQFPFAYYLTQPYDIIINEIMANPTPVVGLPAQEYIELYNRTNIPISLNNWKLRFGSTLRTISNVTIQGNGYLIICGTEATNDLNNYGQAHGVGTITITNGGQTITLSDDLDRLVHTVSFTDSWYQDNSKSGGGWSLEMIDPDNPCAGINNWRASISSLGGTPGTQNSVKGNNPDLTAPQLIRVSIIDNQQIRVWFSESVDSVSLVNTNAYSLSHGLTVLGTPTPVWPNYNSVDIQLSQVMQETVIYTLTISEPIYDCSGNVIEIPSSVKFALSQPMEPGDLIINEILSNPPTGLNEFVEIYNRSPKILDLRDVNLANIDKNTGEVASIQTISEEGFLIFPEEHIVLSRNIQGIKDYYYCPYPNNFLQMSSFPAYNNDEGNVVLIHVNSTIIDRVDYNVSMHFPLLQNTKGVSLERLNYERPSNDSTNWLSASETAGFATPGYVNSQFTEQFFQGEIEIYPEIFSPDNDGYNDVLNISYSFPTPGYVGTINIFDARGRLVRNLVRSELFGTSGVYSWDGITNDNRKSNIGIYIVFVEVFDINGNRNIYKKTAVLGGFLNN
jgi:hypothetical protein